jgi:hypothetical protein
MTMTELRPELPWGRSEQLRPLVGKSVKLSATPMSRQRNGSRQSLMVEHPATWTPTFSGAWKTMWPMRRRPRPLGDSATKAPAKKAPAKAGGKQPKKTSSKTAGQFTCPRCDREFPSKKSLASHNSHCATAQCPECKVTVKVRELDDHRVRIHRGAFIRSIQDQPPCDHGVPGGDILEPNGSNRFWRHCEDCRVDGIRKHYGRQSSTPRPAGQVCEYWVPGLGRCRSVLDVRLYPGHRYRCPDHTPEALKEGAA